MSVSAVREHAHQHVVGVYDQDDDLVSAIARFLADALHRNGAAIVVATPAHRAAIDAAITSAGLPLEALSSAGNYRSLDAADVLAAFMRNDRPDPDAFVAAIETIVTDGAARGGPVRLFGEMVALLWDEGNLDGALEVESLCNDLAARHTFTLFCGYAMSSLESRGDLAAAKRMCDRHSSVIPLSQHPVRDANVSAHADGDNYARPFFPTPTALRDVRGFVRDALRAWGEDHAIVDAEIIASELATNAVKHARSPFRVSLSRTASAIRISVRDASFGRPEVMTQDGLLVGGRGVQLVAALSRAWGTQEEVDGKTVWAELGRVPGE